jgi:hypothetical protein
MEMKPEEKIVAFIEIFSTICGTPPTSKEIGAIPDF